MWAIDQSNYFYLLLLLPCLALIYVYYYRWKNKAMQQFGTGDFLSKLAKNYSDKLEWNKLLPLFGIILMTIIALANPKFGTEVDTVKRQGVDIVFALDVSKSMLANDLAPNRLEKSKQLATQIINSLGADRVGLVAYAGSAFPMMPITSDHNMAKLYVKDLDTDIVSSLGTALSEAVEVSANYFDKNSPSKIIILISDGEDHNEGISEAIAYAKDKNIKIITIGVGTEKGSKILLNNQSNGVNYKKDAEGNDVITKLNTETLQEIAEKSGGAFLYGTQTQDVVQRVDKILSKIEKKDFDSQQIADFQSQFQWFLLPAILLLIFTIIWPYLSNNLFKKSVI